MKNLVLKIKKSHSNIILYISGLIYFILLLPYYLIDYYVPDFRLYFSMASDGAKARDGFSSLFIWFAGLATSIPKQLTVFCLILMSLSIIQISFFIKFLFKEKKYLYCISILTLYSSCCFYYFYGKIFYDFPFTVFTYSLCLLILKKLMIKNQNMKKIDKEWFLFCSLLGFLLSWKPYNIFPLVGLILLMYTKKESKNILTKILKSLKKMGISILFFIFGYVVGNYNLLFYPKATIDGIKAYSARYGFKLFLMGKTRILWDHVNDMPFNVSVMTVVTVIIFLYILPILFKKFEFLLISIFMTICFYLFISYFSPGYAWHGFTMGLFIITYVSFFFSELGEIIINKLTLKNILIGIAISIQMIICFLYYIPLQNRWYSITQESINVLKNNENGIYSDVLDFIDNKIGKDYYTIDMAVKRYKPIVKGTINWRKIDIKYTYIVNDNYDFLDPLEIMNIDGWSNLKSRVNYTTDSQKFRYLIWILPNSFKQMRDVAEIGIYDKFNIVDKIYRKGYTIYLYDTK
jgi:membrane protein